MLYWQDMKNFVEQISITGTTGMNMSVKNNNILHLLCQTNLKKGSTHVFRFFFSNFCKIAHIICNPVFEEFFRKQGYKLCRLFCKSLGKKSENMGWPFF